jgi:hypothetical protein
MIDTTVWFFFFRSKKPCFGRRFMSVCPFIDAVDKSDKKSMTVGPNGLRSKKVIRPAASRLYVAVLPLYGI